MTRYARFNPALDNVGNPTSGSFLTRITYALDPSDAERPEIQTREEPVARAPTDKAWAKEQAEKEAELTKHRGGSKEYDEALAWLDASKLFTQAQSSGDGSAVFIRGFIDARQITPERLSALDEGSIKPNLVLTKPDEGTRESIQIVHSRLQSGVPRHCVMLMQVHRRDGAQDLGNLADVVDGAPYRGPSFALDDACESKSPWDEATKLGETFEWNGTTAIRAEGGFVRIDETLSCSGLNDLTSGRFRISAFATVQTEFVTNLAVDLERVGWLGRLNASPFGVVSQFFTHGVKRAKPSDVREMNLVFDPVVVGDTNDIVARFSVLNDDDNDEFCIVTRVEQNASVFQRILRMPRDGQRPHWDPAGTSDLLFNPPEIRQFGKTIGAEFRALASVEPNS